MLRAGDIRWQLRQGPQGAFTLWGNRHGIHLVGRKSVVLGQARWHMLAIPAVQKVEIGRTAV